MGLDWAAAGCSQARLDSNSSTYNKGLVIFIGGCLWVDLDRF
jgi:hypothetical protein